MAKISNFIYCLNSITNENEANVLGVLSAITPEYVRALVLNYGNLHMM